MKTKQAQQKQTIPSPTKTRAHRIEGDAAAGAVAGVALGAIAGPAGAIAGGVVGGMAGAIAGVALADDAEMASVRDEKLDREIGVTEGDLGEPSLKHPPARVGAYSSASAGAGAASGTTPSEGPMQELDD